MPATRNLTIMFTDIVGYTARTMSQSRAEHAALLKEHDSLLHPVIRRFHGTLVKSMGDGMLVSFHSSTVALRCAMAMQDALSCLNRDRPEERQIQLRIGLGAGDVQVSATDVFGEAVNVAARIEAITPPGEIYFSECVYLAMNKAEVSAELVSSRELKGIPAKVGIYRVLPMGEDGAFLPVGGDVGERRDTSLPGQLQRLWFALRRRPVIWWLVPGVIALAVGLGIRFREPVPVTVAVEPADSQPQAEALPPQPEPGSTTIDPQDRLETIESLLQGGDVAGARLALRDVLDASDTSAVILLAEGHLAFANQQRETGSNIYRKALELEPAFADNSRLAANLVSALGWETKLARELLEQYATPAMLDALAVRTGMPGYWGRLHAVQVLEAAGHGKRVQRLEAALLDLEEAEGCERRRDAVRRLGELGDTRALPILRSIAEMSLVRQLTSPRSCLVDDARAAVARLEGGASKKGSLKGGAVVEDRR